MKKLITISLAAFLINPLSGIAGEYLTGDEVKAQFCGTTHDGQNIKSNWTFKIYISDDCSEKFIHYLTGDKAGTSKKRGTNIYPSGDYCNIKNGKDRRCGKVKDMGNGEFHKFDFKTGKHTHTFSNFVKGKHL